MNDLMFPASSAKTLYAFLLKKSSSIYERTNSLVYFYLRGSASLALLSSSVARKALCLFLMSTLLSYIPKN